MQCLRLPNIHHSKVVELLSIVQPVGEPSESKSGSYMGDWRNWQTRQIQALVGNRAGSSPVSPTMLSGLCNFNRMNPVIKALGAGERTGALCKGDDQ